MTTSSIPQNEKKYREPVLPNDCGEEVEFSNDGDTWIKGILAGYTKACTDKTEPWLRTMVGYTYPRLRAYKYARIKVTE